MTAIDDIAAERRRQIEAEGFTPEHDDAHGDGSLAKAAACYAMADLQAAPDLRLFAIRSLWPWDWKRWKVTDRRRDLIKAGALIVAEIERLDRKGRAP